ncbi:MAG: heme-copper oxidase subunit III [Verrucomicrobia bacterium]|nr:MAG: heme-copper oxidase subunit III [Verrucomicrobiota bacterium]
MNEAKTEPAPPTITEWKLPSSRKVGMISLIVTETALFSIFVVAYVFYIGKSLNPPYPRQILEWPILASIALLSSSGTIVFAEKALHKNSRGGFHFWWLATIILGAVFLGYTAHEWYEFIYHHHFTLATNVFGSTFYSLVGLHASHVIVGLVLLSTVFILSLTGKVKKEHHEHVEMISWYWHFVDAIWIVVFTVVYIISYYA